jgi:hypothetical protein
MCNYSSEYDALEELHDSKPQKVPKRHRINQDKRCKGCNKKGLLYLTKSTNVAFCFACLKLDKNVKIRASLCTRCGEQKRTRRLPLHPPKENVCLRCSWNLSILSGTFTSKVIIFSIGAILALVMRHRTMRRIDPITSPTFWLLIISGAVGLYFIVLMVEERFHKSINKELIHGIIWGSISGMALWISGIAFTSNFLNWLACLLGGALAGILYAVAKRAVEYIDSSR